MPIEINNSYDSYYAQTLNNVNKTAANTDTTNKKISTNEFFKNLCDKYFNVNLNMSNEYLGKKNEITVNVSPRFAGKAANDPKVAEDLNKMLDQMPSCVQFINAHKFTPSGQEVESVSFVIDENGGWSCKCEYKQKDSKDTDSKDGKDKSDPSEISYEEKFREKIIKALKEKAKASKEEQEEEAKIAREHKVYSTLAKNMKIRFLDKSV